ncbi:lysoplasmalogenase [Marivirga salinae]|uniref:Lysoplasmalogenase n=1 Tax=Marivirga salinarum TaxID=3059078 RepID=A0AA49GDD7_9BACT|nr:lysoplasmalogenase [Marivirga sp. BDSF4-3]WKK78063.2 lysoplasmalogenase [Marivirga sp. BDSF4-3]
MNPKLYFYWIIAVVEIIALTFEIDILHQIAKPLLMISLLIYFWDKSDIRKNEKWVSFVTLALVFSWIGDIMLLFTFKHFMFFFAGLSAFLITHIVFIIAYKKATYKDKLNIKWSFFPFVVLGFILLMAYLTLPYVDSVIQVPLVVYGIILSLMILAAWFRKGETTDESFQLVVLGAALFIISDSILAINRFSHTIPFAGVAVMGTYIIAQWLIVNGLLKHNKKQDNQSI